MAKLILILVVYFINKQVKYHKIMYTADRTYTLRMSLIKKLFTRYLVYVTINNNDFVLRTLTNLSS